MCRDCGCSVDGGDVHVHGPHGVASAKAADTRAIELLHGILDANDAEAAHNREHFTAQGVLAVNLMSSPGAGKTRLLEATIDLVGRKRRIAVIEGDLETENDALRIRAKGVPAIQITTGQTCHLDAHMVHEALHALDLSAIDILFIENVGNLVCPAGFDLGQHANVTLLSVTEGDDKPAKYPVMFRAADLVLLSKSDLLEVLDDFSPRKAEAQLRALASPAGLFAVSARKPDTLSPWIAWLEDRLAELRAGLPPEAEGPARHRHHHDHGDAGHT